LADEIANLLENGTRLFEVTVEDSKDNEPMVTFGNPNHSLLFIKFIKIIQNRAFSKSLYPLILSLKIECDNKSQEKIAYYIRKILKNTLFI
jgi:hypothetical protein